MHGIHIDALVGSGHDRLEQVDRELDSTWAICRHHRAAGRAARGRRALVRGDFDAAPLPGPLVDAYGAGDTFAGGLTYALGTGRSIDDALAFAARAGAANLTGRGPYAGQLTAADLST